MAFGEYNGYRLPRWEMYPVRLQRFDLAHADTTVAIEFSGWV